MKEYESGGFGKQSVKSWQWLLAGQLHMLREVGRPNVVLRGFIESDLVDARYYGQANIKNRIESYLQMLHARRSGASVPGPMISAPSPVRLPVLP